MRSHSVWKGLLVTSLITLVATGCLAPDSSGDKTSHGLEEKVVIYSPHGKDILQDFEKMFEKEHPDTDVQWLDMGSQEVLDRVRSEKQNPQADVWWGAPSVMFEQARNEGLLEPYKPTYADALPKEFRADDFSWTGTSQTPEVIMFNTDKVSKQEAPQDWDDLLDPKWKDQILIRYPLASGTMRTIFSAMIYRTYKDSKDPKQGYEWLGKLDANTKEYSPNPEIMYNKIARGEGSITVWNMPDAVMLKEKKNYPFDFVIPRSGTPVLTEGIALVKGAKHSEAAKEFYEFVNSEKAALHLAKNHYRIPTRADLKNLPAWITETKITPMEIDWKVMQEKEKEWMEYWDQNIKNKQKQVEK
ncbi:extracellular solute-binding protein [Paenactinomyces guangxiensis]|uniref:Extracellular solute-binding protein n=1 Tax=Paenactinomyces guangxiensis TaxID=1490290 RepID=A0A7W1WR56_9BACL|nr:extracellular solute-binding protein [Paenactinomyces guangxiensis]MBA4494562.1 extracellular solute-binding protein [Paenactinomyces guangxiensis]MBH8591675.1 extracellular solute-binding protein [Paenactinomyces guangxiensis]